MFRAIRTLKKKGVLGMNCRNLRYIQRLNDRKFYPRADSKLLTKKLAKEVGIAVPDLIGTMEFTGDIKRFEKLIEPHPDFVIKPCRGSGGEGIVVIQEKGSDGFHRGRGDIVGLSDLRLHCANILHGLYSLGGRPDIVVLEERLQFSALFENVTVGGIPDVRVIVYKGVPILAMLRLPTQASRGRANLHQGAIGVGVKMSTGTTTSGVMGSSIVTTHPDTKQKIEGLQLPEWRTLLATASRCYDFSQLGYLGVDLVYDKIKGPLLLEINARPGLSVQLANGIGLIARINQVEPQIRPGMTLEERVELSQSLD